MAINKNFVVKNGLEVADNLIHADGITQKVRIGTSVAKVKLEVKGDVSFDKRIYLSPINTVIKTTTGIVSSTSPLSITGIDTSGVRLGDRIDDGPGGSILSNTKIVSIGSSRLDINPPHTRLSANPLLINLVITRGETSGETGQIIVSGGEFSPARWVDPPKTEIQEETKDQNYYPIFAEGIGRTDLKITSDKLSFNPSTGSLGISTSNPEYTLDVRGDIRATGVVTSNSSFVVVANSAFLNSDDAVIGVLESENINAENIISQNIVSNTLTSTDGNFNTVNSLSVVSESGSIAQLQSENITSDEINANTLTASSGNFDSLESLSLSANSGSIEQLGVESLSAVNSIIDTLTTEELSAEVSYVGVSTAISYSAQEIIASGSIGIGTSSPQRTLDVIGDISFSNRLFAQSTPQLVKTAPGTLNSSTPNFIGINTSNVAVGYLIEDSANLVPENTSVTAVGATGVTISNPHGKLLGSEVVQISFFSPQEISSGILDQVLVSGGLDQPAKWSNIQDIINTEVENTNENKTFYPIFSPVTSGVSTLSVDANGLAYNPSTNSLGIGTLAPKTALDVAGDVTAISYFGDGVNLSGIVTQILPGIGIELSPSNGKGRVTIEAYTPTGKTIYVNQNGDDNNSGLAENYAKRTIKAAATAAIFGDTIKVYPGVYVEENPIVLKKTVSVEGTELRNCVVTPKYPYLDLFHVNNGCHITDMSFIGPEMVEGASIVALQPLEGVSVDRYFDAARLVRTNLDFIANETVGFLTSGFSGFAGNHREQDAARLIDLNLDYIASETVGFLTTASPTGYGFTLSSGDYTNCKEDVVSVFSAVSYDLKANSNKKSVGAALSYFNSSGGLIHITGISTQQATIAAFNYAVGIAKSVINNVTPPISYQSGIGSISQVIDPSVIQVTGGCVAVGTTISQLVGIVTSAIGAGTTSGLPAIRFGVTLESQDCADDIKDIWKCVIHDITRGGNSRCVDAGKAYFDGNWNLIPQILKNPGEVNQTIASVDYSFNVARAVVNNSTWGGYPAGLTTTVSNATYNQVTGITTITATNHGLVKDDAVKIVGMAFTCPSGPGIVTYPSGAFGYIFNVLNTVDTNNFEVVVGQSTLPHNYVSGGTVQKYGSFGHSYSQVKDLAIQSDPLTGFNNAINGCANVISAMKSCVGIVTNIVGVGSGAFNIVGIKTTYPGNSGVGFTSTRSLSNVIYDEETGKTTITAPGFNVVKGDQIELRDLKFSCGSGGGISIQSFPSGKYGYDFFVDKVNLNGTFDVYVGPSTLPHTYVGGGLLVDRNVAVTTAVYDNTTGVTTITAPGAFVREGDFVTIRGLRFSCPSGPAILTYPSGKEGYDFKVNSVIGTGTTFSVVVGTSTLPHTYVSGGVVIPPFSRGVGPITQGPYIRNCTNFVPKSIGMKVDGFAAEPGDKDDIGVTGTMSVDSYTQYNQGGIGVSITNGAYAQLVSIFTICDDIAIFTGSGGQCDITNSNSSFGNFGLVSNGVGDAATGSIYRYTGIANTALAEQSTITVSGIGSLRPYDGQALYFGELFYEVRSIKITNNGFGYTQPPRVVIDSPTGPNGIQAEAISSIDSTGRVSSIDIISTGSQYRISDLPTITIDPPSGPGITATAEVELYPLYYTIESATLPSSGISTITLNTNLNNTVSAGTTAYFSRLSLQIVSSHSFEWVGSGNDINRAKPALGGVVRQENEVVKLNGGEVFYTSTDQAGNFRIGDGFVINQLTGTVTGRSFNQSILNNVTPLIIALGR